jgi:hypothetical protein
MQSLSQFIRNARRRRWKRPTTTASRAEMRRDALGLPARDPGPRAAVDAAAAWLCLAQDRSASADGGVARDYSLEKGWATSYPETTGYIVPTMLELGRRFDDTDKTARARRMLDWLVAIQLPGGGYQGGRIDATPVVPVTFNTGQILLGLASGAAAFSERYGEAMHAAARWLVDSLDADGCWRSHPTPFAEPGEKVYETHVAWGLFEADRVAPGRGYGTAGLRNVRWALTKQQTNGWFRDNCLSDPERPLTHTIGYVLRGVLEAHRLSGERDLLKAACRTADGLLPAIAADGRLPGQLDARWQPAADYVCLTGSVQIAYCLLQLGRVTERQEYIDRGCALNAYVRRTVRFDGPPEVRGAVKGSFPVEGDYGTFEYLNWAPKFLIDACLLEMDLKGS